MLRDAQRIRDVTGNAGSGISGVVRLGLPSTIGPYLLPRVAPQLHAVYPQLKLYVREELPHVLPRELAEGVHDVIVAPLPVNQSGLREAILFEEPLYLAVPLDHAGHQESALCIDFHGAIGGCAGGRQQGCNAVSLDQHACRTGNTGHAVKHHRVADQQRDGV